MTGRFLVALIGVITGFALTQVASAADMPTKAPVYSPPPPPVYGWTGPYIGLSLGWIGSYNRITDVDGLQGPAGEQHKYNSSGITGGVYAGYNWQVTNWVLGVEGDFSGTSAKSSVVIDDDDFDSSATTNVYWTSTFRGRVGYLINPNLLLYGTGGLALAGIRNLVVDFDEGVLDPGSTISKTSTRVGWVAGGGIEYMFTPHIIGRIEGLYMGFSEKTLTTPGGDDDPSRFTYRNNIATARAGVAWKW